MTPDEHAIAVAQEAAALILHKYKRGQREHGGELWRKKGLLNMAIDEAVDQVIYLLTLRDQLAGVDPGELDESV